jgi:hypothetical protein
MMLRLPEMVISPTEGNISAEQRNTLDILCSHGLIVAAVDGKMIK